jgi:hypothetical protein
MWKLPHPTFLSAEGSAALAVDHGVKPFAVEHAIARARLLALLSLTGAVKVL